MFIEKNSFYIDWYVTALTIELERDKTDKMTCAPSKDWDQPGHTRSPILSPCCEFHGQLRTQTFFMRTAKTDQTGQMPNLIFAWFTCHLLVLSYSAAVLIKGTADVRPLHEPCHEKACLHHYLSLVMRKPVFGCLQPSRAQTGLISFRS